MEQFDPDDKRQECYFFFLVSVLKKVEKGPCRKHILIL